MWIFSFVTELGMESTTMHAVGSSKFPPNSYHAFPWVQWDNICECWSNASNVLYPQLTYCQQFIFWPHRPKIRKSFEPSNILLLVVFSCPPTFEMLPWLWEESFYTLAHICTWFFTRNKQIKYRTIHDKNWFAPLRGVIYCTLIRTLSNSNIKALLSSSKVRFPFPQLSLCYTKSW